ncbi:MAG: AAA family ATPase [Romboutsia sp.]
MNYLKIIFKNIEELYTENKAELLETDGLRPSKSIPRDIIKAVLKFKEYYQETQTGEVTRAIVKDEICKTGDTDVVTTNIRTMTELRLLIDNGADEYTFTDEFINLVNFEETVIGYLLKEIENIKSIDDINMIYNGIICVLREGYLNGKILNFPDSKDKFHRNVRSEDKRIEYCKMVNEIYGFRGRNKNPEDADYTPNANYRFITTLKELGFIEKINNSSAIDEYELTEKGIETLKIIEFNLGNVNDTDEKESHTVNNQKMKEIKHPHNRILFGAPGTGKSHTLKKNSKEHFKEENVERVTFHPNYSYSQFVGTYKPKPVTVGGTDITYEYVPGPFLRQLVEAMKSINKSKNEGTVPDNYLLIIEEINRANVASVFGDVFQLLDRDGGESEYSITTSEDMREYLAKELGGSKEEYRSIKLPSNFYIWATMNSADQGVFPMDTAFKRRWSFEYIDIDAGQEKIEEIIVELGENKEKVKWNELRNKINDKLINLNINEDKLLGPFFLSLEELQSEDKFDRAFKSKLLMYLYEDVLRHKKCEFFKTSQNEKLNTSTYSKLVNSYDKFGGDVFDFELDYEVNESNYIEANILESAYTHVADTEDQYMQEHEDEQR